MVDAGPYLDRPRQHFGIGLVHSFNQFRRFRILGNYTAAAGYRYNPLNNSFTDDHHRLSLLLGYEQQLNVQEAMSFYLERYMVRAEHSPVFHGWGVRLLWNHNL